MKLKVQEVFMVFFLVLVCFSMLAGCSASDGIVQKDNGDLAEIGTENQANENHHNLSADGLLQISGDIGKEAPFVLEQTLETNSHKIKITNNSEVTVMIDLYSDADPDNPIRQLTLDSARAKSFTGLTSRFRYRIAVRSDASAQLNLTVSD